MKRKYLAILLAITMVLLTACGEKMSSDEQPQIVFGYGSDEAGYPDSAWQYEVDEPSEDAPLGSEKYLEIDENTSLSTENESMLTFSLKVDTASYTNVQRYIENGSLPPSDAVRVEEMINFFRYEEPFTDKEGPFSIYTEIGPSPFDSNKLMAFMRIKTDDIDKKDLPPSNLVFLIDVSGSMDSYDKLPLLKQAFGLLVDTLGENDRVSIVTYAGRSDIVLSGERGSNKSKILNAIEDLTAGGSTAGANGIKTAYQLAQKNFIKNGNNRVILATDGDFNVGINRTEDLQRFISEKRDTGVFLSVLGFGTGNIRDDIMETLAKDGNGNYSYINSVQTAKKVLVEELGSNLFTLAEDVKTQVEFNPETVKNYRLIGYENRRMDNRDFNDDRKDAGEVGAGTDIVVMFEIELQGAGKNSGYKYGSDTQSEQKQGTDSKYGNELFELRIRYKDPGKSDSKLILRPVTFSSIADRNSRDYVFACSVAAFGQMLRDSDYSGNISIDSVIQMADDARGRDPEGYRYDYLGLLRQYKKIR